MNEKDILENLKVIRQDLFNAYEMNDKILVGFAINDLDNFLYELSEKEKLKMSNLTKE